MFSNDLFVNSVVIATLVLYFIFGYLIVHTNVVVLARKVRITLKYKRINFTLFFYGLVEAFLIVFVYVFWLGVLVGTLITNIPQMWRKWRTQRLRNRQNGK